MVLIDTSAWVEFLRDTGSAECEAVDHLLARGAAVTDPIVMEVLAGGRDADHAKRLRGMLHRAEMLRCASVDYDNAATVHRLCRQQGATIRRLVDCLIGAVAMRYERHLLHADRDFEVMARHTVLKIYAG